MIGLGDLGFSSLYSSNMTTEEANQVEEIMKELNQKNDRKVYSENTRLIKHGEGQYEYRTASVQQNPSEVIYDQDGVTITLTYADYSPLLLDCNRYL